MGRMREEKSPDSSGNPNSKLPELEDTGTETNSRDLQGSQVPKENQIAQNPETSKKSQQLARFLTLNSSDVFNFPDRNLSIRENQAVIKHLMTEFIAPRYPLNKLYDDAVALILNPEKIKEDVIMVNGQKINKDSGVGTILRAIRKLFHEQSRMMNDIAFRVKEPFIPASRLFDVSNLFNNELSSIIILLRIVEKKIDQLLGTEKVMPSKSEVDAQAVMDVKAYTIAARNSEDEREKNA